MKKYIHPTKNIITIILQNKSSINCKSKYNINKIKFIQDILTIKKIK